MVKKLILMAIAAFSVLVADAQVVVQRGGTTKNNVSVQRPGVIVDEDVNTFAAKFGLKAGVNMSSMSNNENNFDPEFSMGVGFRVGAFANLRWGQRTENSLPGTGLFGLQPELMYSYMQFGTDDKSLQMQTVQLPIMLKIYPTVQFNVEVGPEFTYIMSTSPDEINLGSTQIMTGDIKGLNVGVGAGFSYDFEMGLTFGARYSYGFNKMAKNLDWKASNIQVTLGWMF